MDDILKGVPAELLDDVEAVLLDIAFDFVEQLVEGVDPRNDVFEDMLQVLLLVAKQLL